MMNISKPFYYYSHDSWVPVHQWFNFFINSGYYVAQQIEPKKKLVMAITVPAAKYIPSLIGVGLMAGVVTFSTQDNLLENHFSSLIQLPIGTVVRFRGGGRQKIAKFIGTSEMKGELYLKIQTQDPRAGGLLDYVPKRRAFDVSISNNQQLRLPNNQTGRIESKNSVFLEGFFEGMDFRNTYSFSDPKICFVGNKDTLMDETIGTQFGILCGKTFRTGCINEILKIREFQGATELYQSQVLASRSKKSDLHVDEQTVFIYCSAISYLNWADKFPDRISIIILDRTEAQYEFALEEINNRFIENRRFSETIQPQFNNMPEGIELMSWRERR